ncbi:protein of unassigned function [Methylobacterium oryzae CBMB20]|uniref:Protein of unassigned function n=1 Tax=Methylobacterium oryzae CBMB20 TaxID=693986 RepID=A0A089P5D8_9HYPH|nr:protein of unassigned function [Methylobacterium oryzae CBMB20]
MQSDAAGGTAAMRCETNLRLFLLVFRGAAGFFKSAVVAV